MSLLKIRGAAIPVGPATPRLGHVARCRHLENLCCSEDVEHRSYVSSSRASKHPPIVKRSYTYDATGDGESYVSARSHRSSSTIRAPPPPAAISTHSTHILQRSKPGSRVASTIQVGGTSSSQAPRSLSRAASYVSARNVPLPPSGVGTSHANWDDDTESVAPSDSISCVGSRRNGRSYY